MRLNFRFRYLLYLAFSALFLSGLAWIAADRLKDRDDGEMWQQAAANLLMIHGGAAMAALMLLGALVPIHVQRSWRARKNRSTGAAMMTLNAILIVTAFGLYYLGSETLRPWLSDIHIGAGSFLPVALIGHIWLGRRRARNECVLPAERGGGRACSGIPSPVGKSAG